MMRGDFSSAKNWPVSRLVLGTLLLCVAVSTSVLAAPQAATDIPPDATPQIQQITPSQAAPGTQVTVAITGSNFSAGAYVSSVSPAVQVASSKRVSATQLEAQLSVSASAQPSTVSLLVSNPASRAAETAFTIVAGQAPATPATPPQSTEPPKTPAPAPPATTPAPATPVAPVTPPPPAPEVKPSTPATPAVHVAPAAPVVPAAPVAPAAAVEAPSASGPDVTAVTPPRVSQSFDVDIKITGKNFVQGTKVSFANTGVRVLGVTYGSSTALTVHIKVANDAPTGTASLFVINPDDNEAEAPFEVTAKGGTTPATPPKPGAPPTVVSAETQRFDAFHLGNPTEIFHVHGRVKGSLVLSSGTVKYEEDGKTLINIVVSEIKEVNTAPMGQFHITLTSGKTIHFAAASLRPSDARIVVDAIQKAMPR